tara:strand:+ start:3844 stop:4272 length:429 start_codon:yes stop_codon:yes gene_type:complete
MNKYNDIQLEKYTDEEIREIIGKFKNKREQHNKNMKTYYHNQKKKAEEGDEKAQEFMTKRRERAQASYKRLNNKDTITDERRLRNQAIHLFKYWKKKGDIDTFIKNHPSKVELLKKDDTHRKKAKDKYRELFTENELNFIPE